jgi:cation diffusion facilitator CzcD-associated flavoprotein CzcO
MEVFADRNVKGKIKFQTEVTRIYRSKYGSWFVDTEGVSEGTEEPARNVLEFSRIVLCTGVRA